MPPAVAAIASIAASVGIAALKATVLVKAILTIASAIAITLLAKKPKTNRINQGQELRTKFDPNYSREVLAGKVATAGSVHFSYTTTDNSKKPNRYLYRVIQISDRPIHSLLKVMEGANELTFAGDVTTGWRACNQHKTKKNETAMWMRVYLGSDSATADATLVSETGGLWTNNHKGTGLSYAIVKYDYDPDAFPNSEPELVFVVEGAHLYDDRKDSTVSGGSGSHRLATYSTWEYSATTSLIIAQFLRGFYTNGKLILGVGADERDLTAPMLFSAHNTCEQDVELDPGGVFENRYESGIIMKADEAAADILVDLQASMDGKIFDRGGYITILPGADRTPVMEITDSDIDWTAEKSWQPKANLEQMLNHITANFVDSEQNFQERELPVQANAAWEADDGERFSQYFSFRAVNKWTQGQRIVKRLHLASRQSGTVAFVGGIWLLEIEQGDWFTLTTSRWGMTSMYFEVQEINLTADARVMIIAREVDPDNDVWDYSVDEVPRTDSSWTPPTYTLPVPLIYATQYVTTDAVSGAKTFNVETGFSDDPALYGSIVKSLEIQLHWGSVPDINTVGASVANIPLGQKKTTITGLAPETVYYVRGRLHDNYRAGDWTSWISATTDAATLSTLLQAYLNPEATALPANDAGVVTSYAAATTDFVVLKPDGTDISSNFTLSTAPGGNPSGLTVVYTAQNIDVTAGYPTGSSVATLVVRATGGGDYTGIVYDRTFVLIKNTINTQMDAYLNPFDTVNVPTDETNTILDWSPAQPQFIVRLKDGTDISDQFTLSIPGGGNPDGLTYTLFNSANPRYLAVTGGLTIAENPGTLIIEATGSGTYAGVVFRRIFTIYMDKSGIPLSYVLASNDENGLIPDAAGAISSVTKYKTYADGTVSYKGTWSFNYNTDPTHKNNIDGWGVGFYEAPTNAAYTMKGPFQTGGEEEHWSSYLFPMKSGLNNYTRPFFDGANPLNWITIGVFPYRIVNDGVSGTDHRIVVGPITQHGPFQPSTTQDLSTGVTIAGSTAANVNLATGKANTVINSNNNIVGSTKIGGDSSNTATNVDSATGRALNAITSGNKIATDAALTSSLTAETVTHLFAGATSSTAIALDGANYGTYVSVASSNFTVQEGGADVLFIGLVSVRFGISVTDSNLQFTATARITFGGSNSNTFEVTQTVYAAGRNTTVPITIIHLFEGVTSGSKTFYLEVKVDDPSGSGDYAETRGVRAVVITELKR